MSSASSLPTRRIPRTPVVVAALWALLNGVCQSMEWNDGAIPWLILVSSTALAIIVNLVWLATASPPTWPAWVRRGPITVAVVATVAFFATFRVDFSGGMGFAFKNRWGARDADLALDADVKGDEAATAPAIGPADFPQFLGLARDGIVRGTKLARDWEKQPPKLMWKQPIGAGWSAFAAVGPWAVTQEQRGDDEMVTCYEVASGKLRWSHTNHVRFASILGSDGPRATPTIYDGKVYALGATGVLDCLAFATGKLLWSRDIVEESGAAVDNWGKSGSPLIVSDMVIVSAGGPNGKSLLAFDRLSGSPRWSGGDARSAYASPALLTLLGVPQIVIVNEDQIASHDVDTGRVLWTQSWPGKSDANASASQPHAIGGDRVFVSKGYGVGGRLFTVERTTEGWSAPEEKIIWPDLSTGRKVLKTKISNVAIRDGFIYGLDDGTLQCVDVETGKSRWKRGRFEHGQQLMVDDLLLVLHEKAGELTLVEATPEAYSPLGKFQVLEPNKAWNNLCLAGPYLLVRNAQEAACYEMALAP